MEDKECVVCMDVADHSTDCCKQPLHDACLREWIDERKSNVSCEEIYCPYCRQEMKNLPEHIDESWKNDVYFVDKLKQVWGERPFWRTNGAYWGTLEWEMSLTKKRNKVDVKYINTLLIWQNEHLKSVQDDGVRLANVMEAGEEADYID
ncbi:hypothetical protein OS493_035541 [Desmophyllum pertusum]|uniref:RING-type domain-containing protein n=1 Tax=Desmophyllum pertusum TaxID=174260 RepID=A0A9X0CDT9_9CNID|nr:hypothetical protein OS493_035541 [Desmophyllum pertusum]